MRDELAGYRIRAAIARDEAALQTLFDEDPAFFVLTEGAPPRPTEASEVMFGGLPPGLAIDRREVFVAERAGELHGVVEMLVGYPDERTCYLGLIYVGAATRGRGLGTRWLAAIGEHARDVHGAEALRLAVVGANVAARRLYDRLGFNFVARRPRTTWAGIAIETDVLERSLLP